MNANNISDKTKENEKITGLEKVALKIYEPKTKKKLFYIAAFGIPAVIFILIFISWLVYPFGNRSVLVLDLNAQYVYFFEKLRSIFTSGHSLIYSWERALGGEFAGIFGYYVASPLNILLILFPRENITEAILVIEAIKTGLCGLTMAYYLNRRFPTRYLSVLTFSTAYGLSAYIFYFGHNLMWTDNLILLPLVLLGIEDLIKYRKFKLFVISLFLCIFSNFYIGYMMCIFCVFYFFAAYFSMQNNNFYREKMHFGKTLLRIIFFGAIAVGFAAVLLLPVWHSLTMGKTTFTTPDYSVREKFNFFDGLAKLFIGSYDTVRPEGLPMLYCGMFSLLLAPIYFFTSKIPIKEKIKNGFLLLFLFICFTVNTADMVWHGMQRPNWLNYRYSFIFIFFILLIGYRTFSVISKIRLKAVAASAAVLTAFAILAEKIIDKETIDTGYMMYATLIFLCVYIIMLVLLKKHFMKDAVRVFILFTVCAELTISGCIGVRELHGDVVYSTKTSYSEVINKYRPVIEDIMQNDESLYRFESFIHRRSNDSMATGLRGITGSTSTLNNSALNLLEQLGYVRSQHYSRYKATIPFSDSIISIKYVISPKSSDSTILTLKETYESNDDTIYVYENKDWLPIAFGAGELTKKYDYNTYSERPVRFINHLAAAMNQKNGSLDLYDRLNIKNTELENLTVGGSVRNGTLYNKINNQREAYYNFIVETPEKESDIFLAPLYSSAVEFTVDVNGVPYSLTGENDSYGMIYLGKFKGNSSISVKIKLQEDKLYLYSDNDFFYALNEDNYNSCMSYLKKEPLNITSYSDTEIKGIINIESDNHILFTSIPFDSGWQVEIDGHKAEKIKILDSLLAVNISKGEHTVSFKYSPKEYKIGGAISATSLILFIGAWIVQNKVDKKRKKDYLELYLNEIKK